MEPEIRAVMQDVLGRTGGVVRDELEKWARARPEETGEDPVAWAAAAAPVLISAVPGFILQRIVFEDFDDEKFLEGMLLAFRG